MLEVDEGVKGKPASCDGYAIGGLRMVRAEKRGGSVHV